MKNKNNLGAITIIFTLGLLCISLVFPLFQVPPSAKASRALSPEDLPFKVYQPMMVKNYPLVTVFGVTMDYLDASNGITQLAAAQTTWTRRVLDWGAVEPGEGQRNWNPYFDQEMINAKQHGIEPIVILEHTPTWALKPGFSCGAVAQNKFQALGNFMFDAVRRYSAPPYFVRYWELWNEPDVYGFLGCWGDPSDFSYYGGSYYGMMIRLVYPMIKAADPNAQVLVGGLLLGCDPAKGSRCVSSRFLEGILAAGSGPFFDGVSFHAYDYYAGQYNYNNLDWNSTSDTTGPVSIKKGNYLKGLLSQYGYPDKYLINTETAIFWGPNVLYPRCSNPPSAIEEAKVNYVVQSYAAAVANGWLGNIWYSALGARCSALFSEDLSPKPAFLAYQNTAEYIRSAEFIRQIIEYPGIMGYEYSTGTQRIWIVWSLDGNPHWPLLPVLPASVNRISPDGTLFMESPSTSPTVTLPPVFITFQP